MNTKEMLVVGGEKGFVPVFDNSHGGAKIGSYNNGDVALLLVDEVEEYGYGQIYAPKIPSPNTNQRWIEKTHLQEIEVVPTYKLQKFHVVKIYLKDWKLCIDLLQYE